MAGTAVLQIGTASLFTRFLTVCDGGIYTCVATSPDESVHKRNFTLIVGCKYNSIERKTIATKTIIKKAMHVVVLYLLTS